MRTTAHASTIDLHASQIQGFFDIPVDNLYSAPVLVADIKKNYNTDNLIIISPDVGGVVRARYIAKKLNCDLAIVDKRREKTNVSEVLNIIGDVKKRDCLLIDDIVDTAGTLTNAADALIDAGARTVSAYASHGVLSSPAIERLNSSKLSELVITNTISKIKTKHNTSRIKRLSVGSLIAEAIRRIGNNSSVSSLFD